MYYTRNHSFGPVQGFEVGLATNGKPFKSVYLYRVASVLVDTGPHHLRKQVRSWIDGKDIATILLTHHHEDHSGNAALLQSQSNAPVHMHSYGVEKLSRGFKILPYQHILFGKASPLQAQVYPDTIEGENLTFKPIHTPGHSKDHTVYYVKEEGWLFSGDLWVGERIHFFRTDEHIDQQIESLQKVAELDFEMLFCGHRPRIKNGPMLVKRKLDFLVSFKEQVIDLHQQGFDAKAIAQELRRKRDLPIRLFTMGNVSFTHMVKSAIKTTAKKE